MLLILAPARGFRCARCIGDPTFLVADPTPAREVLKFRAQHSDLTTIIRTAWGWHRKAHPLKK